MSRDAKMVKVDAATARISAPLFWNFVSETMAATNMTHHEHRRGQRIVALVRETLVRDGLGGQSERQVNRVKMGVY